jgi:hypothetical protein
MSKGLGRRYTRLVACMSSKEETQLSMTDYIFLVFEYYGIFSTDLKKRSSGENIASEEISMNHDDMHRRIEVHSTTNAG